MMALAVVPWYDLF